MRIAVLRSMLAAALLGVFGLTIVPRDLLHRCDQEHVDHHHPDGAAINGDLDCEICSVFVATFDDRAWKPHVPVVLAADFRFVPERLSPIERVDVASRTRGPPLA